MASTKKLTTKIFIERARKKHGDKFDYLKVVYKNTETKVDITCKKHGIFKQTPHNHMSGYGCPKCKGEKNSVVKKKSNEDFIQEAKLKHNNKYDYSKTNYKNSHSEIEIVCKKHGSFFQKAYHHIQRNGCPKCSFEKKTMPEKEFIERAKKIHKNNFTYDLVDYKNSYTKIKIVCKKKHVFLQEPSCHLMGQGCKKCDVEKRTISQKEFIKKARLKHGSKYDYSLVDYKNSRTKVEIICPKHGKFTQLANAHIRGAGCQFCSSSKGEEKINKFLEGKKIKFEREKGFSDCKYKQKLLFDFYLPEYNYCIEFDGRQHFFEDPFFGGREGFELTKKRDNIKTRYCFGKKIKLIRIPYFKIDEIEKILEEYFNAN